MRVLIIFTILFYSYISYGQLKKEYRFPAKLNENSGLEKISKDGLLWVIEDSGNKNHVYGVDKKGKIKKDIELKNAKNNDWEDLTKDEDGNLYIGDFGNNENKRKKLRIYKISNPDLISKDKTEATIINFYYPEQKKFPPKKSKRNFDAEAFFYFKNSLYIFTKNRTSPYTGKTYLYKIPAKKGNHAAKLMGSFKTCDDFLHCSITAAAMSPDQKKIVLLTHDKIWVFSDFSSDRFLDGQVKEIPLKNYTQKEGICFKNNHTLYISDEYNLLTGRNLYSFKLD